MTEHDTYPNDAAFEYGFQHGQDLINACKIKEKHKEIFSFREKAHSLNSAYEKYDEKFKALYESFSENEKTRYRLGVEEGIDFELHFYLTFP